MFFKNIFYDIFCLILINLNWTNAATNGAKYTRIQNVPLNKSDPNIQLLNSFNSISRIKCISYCNLDDGCIAAINTSSCLIYKLNGNIFLDKFGSGLYDIVIKLNDSKIFVLIMNNQYYLRKFFENIFKI